MYFGIVKLLINQQLEIHKHSTPSEEQKAQKEKNSLVLKNK